MTEQTSKHRESFARRNRLWLVLLLLLLLLLAAGLCAGQVLGGPPQALPTPTRQADGSAAADPPEQTIAPSRTSTEQATVVPTATASSTPEYACNGALAVSHQGGSNWRVSFDVPGIELDQSFPGMVSETSIQCHSYEQYPDRVYCDVFGSAQGSVAEVVILDGGNHEICRDKITFPVLPTRPPEQSSGGDGGTCSPPEGGCTGLNCIWNPDSCTCEFDGSCIN